MKPLLWGMLGMFTTWLILNVISGSWDMQELLYLAIGLAVIFKIKKGKEDELE